MSGIELYEMKFHLRNLTIGSIIRKIKQLKKTMKENAPDLILFESPGLASFIVMLFIDNIPFTVRMKGDLWLEYEEIRYGLNGKDKCIRIINFKTGL
ncbi:MAG: hypothetical protein ACFFG0_19360, partial [Candidatus Thorarchaeota archaeon]